MSPKTVLVCLVSTLFCGPAWAIDLRDPMRLAAQTGRESGSLVSRQDIRIFWPSGVAPMVYRVNSAPGESEFHQVDLATGKKSAAFDAESFAKALAEASGKTVAARTLPIDAIEAVDGHTFRIRALGKGWHYESAGGKLTPEDFKPRSVELLPPQRVTRGGRSAGGATELTIENATGGEIEMFWVNDGGERKSYGKIAPGGSSTQNTYAGHAWLFTQVGGDPLAGVLAPEAPSFVRVSGRVAGGAGGGGGGRRGGENRRQGDDSRSPDETWRASIRENNVVIQSQDETVSLTTDGTADNAYNGPFRWSPDSKKLVAYRTKKVTQRQISMVQSSPPNQVQPVLKTIDYTKPGDPIRQPLPQLFDISNKRAVPLDRALFDNPWEISQLEWAEDSSEFTFIYNQRGHQVMRMVGIRGDSGSPRTVFEDLSKTFIDYSQKFYFHRIPGTRECIWASERDGHNHLYRIDTASGEVKAQITRGDWNVREVVSVDDGKRQLLLKVLGVTGQSPYHEHFVRVNFDGSGFTRLTTSDGTHRIEFSPDGNFIIDTWSRVDQPPVVEIRRAADGTLVSELERADDAELRKTGWSRPERFVAKGRDGKTDIYGVIVRPTRFDPAKRYPVVETIYAGPHDFFVQQSYSTWSSKNDMAELGFVLVSIDGMGTNWRSREFHDVCWKNLSDAGFPDRIPWIKAAAADRPWMDVSRVGIYGGSAGGQNALAGLLLHGDFYKVGVADCGCHDNRMDKIWWNEAWMGWPVDDSYARNSNVTLASKLTGKLMLVVGELDTNVDPASTMQVINALQKADKDYEFVPVTNSNHGAAESPYGRRRRAEFLVRNLITHPPGTD